MHKNIISQQAIYSGEVKMPAGFEIDSLEMAKNILESSYTDEKVPFTKTWDRLNKFIKEHIRIKFDLTLSNMDTWGNMYLPKDKTNPLRETDLNDLKNSPDYVCLYGIISEDVLVRIYYNDNRRQGKFIDMDLSTDKFIIFPANNFYHIENRQDKKLNFIQTITYEYL